jgi:hypothetical protein
MLVVFNIMAVIYGTVMMVDVMMSVMDDIAAFVEEL